MPIDNSLALKIQVPEFDLGKVMGQVAQIQHNQANTELGRFKLQEGQRRSGDLSAFADAMQRGDPEAHKLLAGHPEDYGHALKNQSAAEADKQARNARDLAYVAAFPEGSQERSLAWRQKLDAAGREGRLPTLMHQQLVQQEPSDQILQRLIDSAGKPATPVDRSHAGYYDAAAEHQRAMAKAVGVKADAVTENAATRRFRAYTDYMDRLGGGTPSQDQWDAMNQQPNGLNLITFGRAIPYSDAPRLLSEVRSRVAAGPAALEFEPTAQEVAMGITKEDKLRAIKQRTINDMYGVKDSDMLKKGVRLKSSGDFEAIPGASTAAERQGEVIARQGLKMLERGEKALAEAGPLDQVAGDQWRIPFTDINVGGWGKTGEGFQSIKAAILDLNFALSGKSVSNAERKAFLELYMPTSMESRRRQAFKIGQIRSYFEEVMRMRHGGASDDDVAEFYRQKIHDAEKNAETGEAPKNRGRLPGQGQPLLPSQTGPGIVTHGPDGSTKVRPSAAPSSTPRSLSNEELLRQLNK